MRRRDASSPMFDDIVRWSNGLDLCQGSHLRVIYYDYGLEMSSFHHPEAVLSLKRKVPNVLGQGSILATSHVNDVAATSPSWQPPHLQQECDTCLAIFAVS